MKLSDFGLVPCNTMSVYTGDRYGRLTVNLVGRDTTTKKYYAVCQCDCGSKPRKVRVDKLIAGLTKSCPCAKTTHGLSKHPLYRVWSHMMQRCYDKNTDRYPRYGGRGIRVCKRWHDVSKFVEDMESTHKSGLTIERVNNDGDYRPSNCKWAGAGDQANNRSSNARLKYRGKNLTVAQWSRRTGINYQTLYMRIAELGWTLQEALTTPPRTGRSLTYNGETHTLAEWARITGIPCETLHTRVSRGWTERRTLTS